MARKQGVSARKCIEIQDKARIPEGDEVQFFKGERYRIGHKIRVRNFPIINWLITFLGKYLNLAFIPKVKIFILIGLGLSLNGCRWFEDSLNKDIYPFELSRQGIAYSLSWPSPLDKEIKTMLEANSLLVKLEQRPPISLAGLVKRCEKDQASFKSTLAAIGYFKSKVNFKINTQTQPLSITLHIALGPRYRLESLRAETLNQYPLSLSSSAGLTSGLTPNLISAIVHFKKGEFVDLEKAFKGRDALKAYLQNKGYPFVEVSDPLGKINHSKKTVEIIYPIELHNLAIIRATEIEGLKHLDKDYIVNRLSWKEGEVFSQEKLEKSYRKLLETGLLSSVQITPEKIDNSNNSTSNSNTSPNTDTSNTLASSLTPQAIKMVVKTAEGAARAIGIGAKYSTSEGLGGHLFWHHNNLGHHGQHLGFSFRSTKKEMKAKVAYTVPDFIQPLQVLKNEAMVLRERNRAYVSRTYSVGTLVERPLVENIIATLGICAEGGRIRREQTTFRTRLIGIPAGLRVDYANNLLDPTRGLKLEGKLTPYYGRLGSAKGMIVGYSGLSTYLPFDTNEVGESRFVLANFLKLGSIFNQILEKVPPNKRFYAGGGDSIRGYGYQLLGPLDSKNIPEGGNSLAEVGAEIRVKTAEKIGFVSFIEGGAVTKTAMPKVFKTMLWGAGVGFRYYSPLGPIRIDLAFPLKRRKGITGKPIDSIFQFYLSIGQAF